MKITSLARQKRRRDRINVYLDGEFALALPEEVALRSALRVGGELDEEALEVLRTSATEQAARDAALSLLSHRARSRRELRRRLLHKGFADPVVEGCLARLESTGLLDDSAFSLAFVSDRIRSRPKGRSMLISELRARGVDADLAEACVDEALGAGSGGEVELARRAADKFRERPGEDPVRARRRLYGFLVRRGFAAATIRQMLDEPAD